jgi:hypothetical protein
MRRTPGSKFRWLTVGLRAQYVGRGGRPELRGREGEVVAVPRYGAGGGPKNALVLLDGDAAATSAPVGCWRPA